MTRGRGGQHRGNNGFRHQVSNGAASAIGWALVAVAVYVLFQGKFKL